MSGPARPGPIRYARTARGHVAHQVTGDSGPWLVLLPTLTASFTSLWELPSATSVLAELARHCRVVLLDRRGTGSSDPLAADEAADARTHAGDVVAVLRDLDAEAAVVVGESYAGGPAALHAAAVAPERIARVVAISVPVRPVTDRLDLDPDEVVEAILWGDDEGGTTADLDLNPSVADDEGFAAWAEQAGRATSPGVARSMWEAMLAYDLREVAEQVTVPVTVVTTGHWSAPTDRVLELAHALPDAEVVESPRVDTLFFLGEAAAITGELLLAATGRRHAPATRRRLLAVLLHDLVDSTAQAARLGDQAWRDRLDAHDRIVGDVLAVHGGTLVKHTGDGALTTFPLASAAVEAATMLVAQLDASGLQARAGLHLGEVEVRGDDIGGLAVHVAARVLDAADDGQVLTTTTVRTATLGSGHAYGESTTHRLRGVPGSWELAPLRD